MKRICAMLLLAVLLCGCAETLPPLTEPFPTALPAEPIYVEPASPESGDRLAAIEFALDLLRTQKPGAQNTLLSPLSLLAALGMTANGANSETLAQMEQVLGLSAERLCAIMPTYLVGSDQLRMANGIWYRDRGMTVFPAFLDACADYYSATATPTPMDETTREAINAFIDEHTAGMIPDMLPEGAIGPGIVMLLVNALAFEADWAKQFEQFRNSDDAFAGVNGTVTYMQSTERLYLEDNRAVGFIKPYAGDRYAFAAILPNEGISLDEYLAALDSTALVNLLDGAADATVIVRLPKFGYDFDVDLAEALGEVGMTDAFDGGKADFSRLGHAVDGNIFIEKVLHRTHIALGEKGTKAAAASAIVMIPETVWIPPKDAKYVYLTRPFLYMIVDLDTNMPVFMGTVVDPS